MFTFPEVRTNNMVKLDGPLEGRFTAAMAAHLDAGPLKLVTLEGQEAATHTPKIAIIEIDGMILNQNATGLFSQNENPVALVHEKLKMAQKDPNIRGILLRVNSPGGSVSATDMLWRELVAFRKSTQKPVVACLMDVATGGGYYLAAACDYIVAHPGTMAGGIGVILNLYNLQDLMAQFNVVPQTIKSGQMIDMGTMQASLTTETRTLLQAMADEYHQQFIQAVKQSRKSTPELETAFDGRVVSARQAHQMGLVDQVGYLEDALQYLRNLSKSPAAETVMMRRPNDPARSPYATSPNAPITSLVPLSIPGIDRSKLPTFLYVWQPDPGLERLGGKQ
ncbi:MAG TPA: signal peptide peptidase SppA [Gemmatales bacterium]|nr:signal peptide peptidase SppA [Gemmatales bacterium]